MAAGHCDNTNRGRNVSAHGIRVHNGFLLFLPISSPIWWSIFACVMIAFTRLFSEKEIWGIWGGTEPQALLEALFSPLYGWPGFFFFFFLHSNLISFSSQSLHFFYFALKSSVIMVA